MDKFHTWKKPDLTFDMENARPKGCFTTLANSLLETTTFFLVNDKALTALAKESL